MAVIAVALLAGSSGPSLEVSSRMYVDGPQNVARLAGTAEPGDALVAAGGRRTRARDGRWSLRVRPSRAGEVRLRASEGGETAATTVVVPGPRLAGTWRVVQTDVLANAVIGGRVRGARAIWSFRALCSEGRCSGAVLAFPSPTGATRIRLRRRGKVFTGTRSYTLPRSGSCAGQLYASRWTTRIKLVITRSRARPAAPIATRFTGSARHRSRLPDGLPCDDGRLVTRLRARPA